MITVAQNQIIVFLLLAFAVRSLDGLLELPTQLLFWVFILQLGSRRLSTALSPKSLLTGEISAFSLTDLITET